MGGRLQCTLEPKSYMFNLLGKMLVQHGICYGI